MAGNAVKVRAPSGWVDLAYVATGPQGVKGDTGPGVAAGGSTGQLLRKKSATSYDTEWATPTPESPGRLLAVQRVQSAQADIGIGIASGQEFGLTAAGGTDFRLTYTPTVDAWWEVNYWVGQLYKSSGAGWTYGYGMLTNLGAAIPTVGGVPGFAPSAQMAQAITSSVYGVGGPQYETLHPIQRVLPLTAGQTYTVGLLFYSTAAYAYVSGRAYLFASGKAYSR